MTIINKIAAWLGFSPTEDLDYAKDRARTMEIYAQRLLQIIRDHDAAIIIDETETGISNEFLVDRGVVVLASRVNLNSLHLDGCGILVAPGVSEICVSNCTIHSAYSAVKYTAP